MCECGWPWRGEGEVQEGKVGICVQVWGSVIPRILCMVCGTWDVGSSLRWGFGPEMMRREEKRKRILGIFVSKGGVGREMCLRDILDKRDSLGWGDGLDRVVFVVWLLDLIFDSGIGKM